MSTTTTINSDSLDIFSKPARILIFGLSGAGKSHLVSKLVRKYYEKFDEIVTVGADLENLEDTSVRRDDDFDPIKSKSKNEKVLVIYDDILYKKNFHESAAKLFIYGRPSNVSVIFISQALFVNDNFFRIMNLNASHIIFLTIRNIKSLRLYVKSFMPEESLNDFINLYMKVVLQQAGFNHLLVDFQKPFPNNISFRSNIVPENDRYEEAFSI